MSLEHIARLLEENRKLRRAIEYYDHNLSSVQSRCTELFEENRTLRRSLVLLGWTCRTCLVFNGEAKERLAFCRCCGASRPS